MLSILLYILVDDSIPDRPDVVRWFFVLVVRVLVGVCCVVVLRHRLGRMVPWVSCVRTATAAMVRSCVFVEKKFHVEVFD